MLPTMLLGSLWKSKWTVPPSGHPKEYLSYSTGGLLRVLEAKIVST